MKCRSHVIGALLLGVSGSTMSGKQVSRTHCSCEPRQRARVAELAAGFARASGHKVTVVNETGRRWSSGSPTGPPI